MKKEFLFIALLSIIILSCEKEEGNEKKQPSTEFELELDTYGLFDVEKEFESYSLGIDTNHVYFNGRLDQKLCVEAFNKTNKTNLLSWESDDKLSIEVHEGYGVNSTHEITKFITITPYSYNDDHVYVLWGLAEGSQYPQNQRIITSDLYFTSGNKKYESMTFPTNAYFYYDLIPWYEDKVIVTKKPVESYTGKVDSCYCYSMDGTEIFNFTKNNNYPTGNYIAISTSNYIKFFTSVTGNFTNVNIIENKKLWESEAPLNDLPEDTRIDSVELSRYNADQISCVFKYTLFSGEQGTREVKVNIETGIISN